jgi:NADH-quinone oxidoreductase subunit C
MFFYKSQLIELSNLIKLTFSNAGLSLILNKNNLYISVNYNNLHLLLNFLKLNSVLQFNSLVDIFGIDLIYQKNRFNILYCLINYFSNIRIFIKTSSEKNLNLPSSSDIFDAADWLEREVYDMFGIYFDNHPDLRRILTDYGFKGYPLRKDFPLIGYFQLKYDEIQSKIVYESVTLSQKYRFFKFSSPWNQEIKQLNYKILI